MLVKNKKFFTPLSLEVEKLEQEAGIQIIQVVYNEKKE
jgi:hypothetical protein